MTSSFFSRWAVSALLLAGNTGSFVVKVLPKPVITTKRNMFIMEPRDYDEFTPIGFNNITNSQLLGGSYAGVQTSVDPATGMLVPLPSNMIPNSLRERGIVPSAHEILIREAKKGPYTIHRDVMTVLPSLPEEEDTLETSVELLTLEFDSTVTPDYETLFYLTPPTPDGLNKTVVEALIRVDFAHRMRVVVEVFYQPQTSTYSIRTPIVASLEHMLSRNPKQKIIPFGGGVYPEYMRDLLGTRLNSTSLPFLDQEQVAWTPDPGLEHLTTVTVPGNVTVAYGQTDETTFDLFFVYMDVNRRPYKCATLIKEVTKLLEAVSV